MDRKTFCKRMRGFRTFLAAFVLSSVIAPLEASPRG